MNIAFKLGGLYHTDVDNLEKIQRRVMEELKGMDYDETRLIALEAPRIMADMEGHEGNGRAEARRFI